MEQSDSSRPNMGTDKETWEKMQKELNLPEFTEEQLRGRLALSYLQKPDMIRFLLQDSLALKMLLLEKGIISVDEFDQFKEKAGKILYDQINKHIDKRLKDNPAESKLYDVLLGKKHIDDLSFDDLKEMGENRDP